MAILALKDGSDIVMAVVDAIVKGYKEDLILEDLAQAIESKKIDQASFESAIDALRLFANRFTVSLNMLADSMEQFEFHEPQDTVLKNKPMSLAQQVMQDIHGFRGAMDSYNAEQGGEPAPEQEVDEQDEINWPESR